MASKFKGKNFHNNERDVPDDFFGDFNNKNFLDDLNAFNTLGQAKSQNNMQSSDKQKGNLPHNLSNSTKRRLRKKFKKKIEKSKEFYRNSLNKMSNSSWIDNNTNGRNFNSNNPSTSSDRQTRELSPQISRSRSNYDRSYRSDSMEQVETINNSRLDEHYEPPRKQNTTTVRFKNRNSASHYFNEPRARNNSGSRDDELNHKSIICTRTYDSNMSDDKIDLFSKNQEPTNMQFNSTQVSNHYNNIQVKKNEESVAKKIFSEKLLSSEFLTKLSRRAAAIGIQNSYDNENMIDVLHSCLLDAAPQLLANLPISHTDYNNTDDIRNNKRILLNNQMELILNITPLPSNPTAQDLENFLRFINNAIAELELLGQSTSNWDLFLVCHIVRLLDKGTQEHWEDSIANSEISPTYEQLEQFMQNRIYFLQDIERSPVFDRSPIQDERPCPSPMLERTQYQQSIDETPYGYNASYEEPEKHDSDRWHQQHEEMQEHVKQYECDCCYGKHFIVHCPQYKMKRPAERLKIAKHYALCFNCLGRHSIRSCRNQGMCGICNKKHHTMLHHGFPTH